MRKLIIFIITISLCTVLCCCDGIVYTDEICDYYGEYTFKIPFGYNTSYRGGGRGINFETDYSMEQMNQLINEAGYQADLYENGGVKKILISVAEDEFTYYFVVFDKGRFYNNVQIKTYELESAGDQFDFVYTETHSTFGSYKSRPYSFLAPAHIIDSEYGLQTREVYGTFDEIADFYRATGKNDVVIDDENKLIYFETKTPSDSKYALSGTLVMQYTETETGNYLTIKLME